MCQTPRGQRGWWAWVPVQGSPPPTGQDGNTATEPREGCEPRACGECSSLALAGSSGLEAAGGTLECRL